MTLPDLFPKHWARALMIADAVQSNREHCYERLILYWWHNNHGIGIRYGAP